MCYYEGIQVELALLGLLFCIPLRHFNFLWNDIQLCVFTFKLPISWAMFDVGSTEVSRRLIYVWQICSISWHYWSWMTTPVNWIFGCDSQEKSMRGKNDTAFQTGPESVYPSFAHWQLHWVYLFNCLLTHNEPITLQQPILACRHGHELTEHQNGEERHGCLYQTGRCECFRNWWPTVIFCTKYTLSLILFVEMHCWFQKLEKNAQTAACWQKGQQYRKDYDFESWLSSHPFPSLKEMGHIGMSHAHKNEFSVV